MIFKAYYTEEVVKYMTIEAKDKDEAFEMLEDMLCNDDVPEGIDVYKEDLHSDYEITETIS